MSLLLSDASLSLALWLGEPFSRKDLKEGLSALRGWRKSAVRERRQEFNVWLAELIIRYWSEDEVDMVYHNLLATCAGRRDRAQLELCYGQLLIARKRRSAWQHLDEGFALAAHILEPEEYFTVLKRHDFLRNLPLREQAAAGAGLEQLLSEARLIAGLRGRARTPQVQNSEHGDTLS